MTKLPKILGSVSAAKNCPGVSTCRHYEQGEGPRDERCAVITVTRSLQVDLASSRVVSE